jgi:hypothetical protein
MDGNREELQQQVGALPMAGGPTEPDRRVRALEAILSLIPFGQFDQRAIDAAIRAGDDITGTRELQALLIRLHEKAPFFVEQKTFSKDGDRVHLVSRKRRRPHAASAISRSLSRS